MTKTCVNIYVDCFVLITECSLSFCSGASITEVLFPPLVSLSQISTNFSGWYELGEALTQVDTSKSMTTTPPLESSELTVKDHLSSSTASCTRCVTIALARSTRRPVSIFVIMNLFLQSCGPQNLHQM